MKIHILTLLTAVTLTSAVSAQESPRSLESQVQLNVSWVNESAEPVDLFWVDFSAQEHFAARIAPGDRVGGISYATHVFLVKRNGQVTKTFQLAAEPLTQVHVVADAAVQPPQPQVLQGIFAMRLTNAQGQVVQSSLLTLSQRRRGPLSPPAGAVWADVETSSRDANGQRSVERALGVATQNGNVLSLSVYTGSSLGLATMTVDPNAPNNRIAVGKYFKSDGTVLTIELYQTF